jgi:hypothetical protein
MPWYTLSLVSLVKKNPMIEIVSSKVGSHGHRSLKRRILSFRNTVADQLAPPASLFPRKDAAYSVIFAGAFENKAEFEATRKAYICKRLELETCRTLLRVDNHHYKGKKQHKKSAYDIVALLLLLLFIVKCHPSPLPRPFSLKLNPSFPSAATRFFFLLSQTVDTICYCIYWNAIALLCYVFHVTYLLQTRSGGLMAAYLKSCPVILFKF